MTVGSIVSRFKLRMSAAAFIAVLVSQSSFSQDLIVEPCQLRFTAIADSAVLPPAQTINIKSFSGAGLPYLYSGGSMEINFKRIGVPLTISPSSGTTPGSASVSLEPMALAKFPPSDYVYTLYFSTVVSPPPYTFCTAQITILPAPKPILTSVLNAASLQQGAIAPAEIVTILGTNIAPQFFYLSLVQIPPGFVTFNFPFTTGGTRVTFNGLPAPILYAANGQINAMVPVGIAGAPTAEVIVEQYGQRSEPFTVPVATAAAGILSVSQIGNGQGIILNTDYSITNASHPAKPGGYVVIIGTGGGLFDQSFPDGRILNFLDRYPRVIAPVSVSIGGKEAVVTYAGQAPRFVYGALQVNAIVPPDTLPGVQDVVLTIDGKRSQQRITMVVQ